MKKIKLLLITLGLVLLSSCANGSYEASIGNPERATTVELLSMSRDSVEIINMDDKCYIIKDELIVAKAYYGGPGLTIVSLGFVIFSVIVMIILFIVIINQLD